MVDPLLSVERLIVERGGRIVLSDLGFALGAGETILVSGRNGAGKSTLLRAIAGLLPIQGGWITYGRADENVRGVETIHYLGYEDALKPSLTVGENLDFWASLLGDTRTLLSTEGMVSSRDALKSFGIPQLIDLPAACLSAGQKRRVALARLLLAPRPIWLLDEPLIALDAGAQDILTAIMATHVAAGGAILVASHQMLALPHRQIDLGLSGAGA